MTDPSWTRPIAGYIVQQMEQPRRRWTISERIAAFLTDLGIGAGLSISSSCGLRAI